jgi:hypothetical protein
MLLEGHIPLSGMVRGLNHHHDHEIIAQPGEVQRDTLAEDQAFGLKPVEPPPAGILGQADPVRQRALAERRLSLEHHQELAINAVNFDEFCGHMIEILDKKP